MLTALLTEQEVSRLQHLRLVVNSCVDDRSGRRRLRKAEREIGTIMRAAARRAALTLVQDG